jgi:hypothetical protein
MSAAFCRSINACLARSSRFLDSASSAFSVQLAWSSPRRAVARRISLLSAMQRAAEARTSTKVSSISRMTMRIIFAGSSDRSRSSVILAAKMSRALEKMLIHYSSSAAMHGWLSVKCYTRAVPFFRNRQLTAKSLFFQPFRG